ncbi:hypothetical protein BCR35DRAFT_265140, partial [Leucosporidium creatinivorum]
AGNARSRVALVAAQAEGLELDVKTHTFPTDAAYRQKFPLGLVPTLEKDDFKLSESVAVATYIASYNNKAGLVGATKEDAAAVQQWMNWANASLLLGLAGWFRPLIGAVPYNKTQVEQAKTSLLAQTTYLEQALATKTFLVGDRFSLADVFVASALTRGFELVLDAEFRAAHINIVRYFNTVIHQEAYYAVIGAEPTLVEKAVVYTPPKKEAKPAAAPKAAPAPKAAAEEEEPVEAAPKAKHPCEALGPAKSFPLDEFKRQYSNNETDVALKWLDANFDPQEYSLWKAEYKYPDELTQVFMSSNLITGFHSRLEGSRKYVFGSTGVYGENNNSKIVGVYMIRGSDWKGVFDVAPDYESYSFTPLDFKAPADREFVEGCWAWTNEVDGLKYADGKVMK